MRNCGEIFGAGYTDASAEKRFIDYINETNDSCSVKINRRTVDDYISENEFESIDAFVFDKLANIDAFSKYEEIE